MSTKCGQDHWVKSRRSVSGKYYHLNVRYWGYSGHSPLKASGCFRPKADVDKKASVEHRKEMLFSLVNRCLANSNLFVTSLPKLVDCS